MVENLRMSSRYTSYDCQIPFRMRRDQLDQLDRASRHCNQSKQAFVLTTVFAKVKEILEPSIRPQKEEKDENVFSKPEGLGSSIDRIINQHRDKENEEESQQVNAQAPVVVNVGGGAATNGTGSNAVGGDIIDRLATHIVSGRDFEQSQRMRYAVEVLAGTTSSDEERKTLAARLDEAVAAKKNSKRGDSTSFARMAFNKLSHLLSE